MLYGIATRVIFDLLGLLYHSTVNIRGMLTDAILSVAHIVLINCYVQVVSLYIAS